MRRVFQSACCQPVCNAREKGSASKSEANDQEAICRAAIVQHRAGSCRPRSFSLAAAFFAWGPSHSQSCIVNPFTLFPQLSFIFPSKPFSFVFSHLESFRGSGMVARIAGARKCRLGVHLWTRLCITLASGELLFCTIYIPNPF